MRIRVFQSAETVARWLAEDVARSIVSKPDAVLGLPAGKTPTLFYRHLIRLYTAHRVDFARVTTFNVDEFLGLGRQDAASYRQFMRAQLFDHINIPRRRAHSLNGGTRDAARECRRYERAIARAGGIDLQVLGLGTNGHVGFNEPAAALCAFTHRTRLSPATRRANAPLFGDRLTAVPKEGLSMGMGTILRSRRIVLVATGSRKARSVARMIRGPVTPLLPASFLQLHPNAEVWLDRDAASRLSGAPSSAPRRPRQSRP